MSDVSLWVILFSSLRLLQACVRPLMATSKKFQDDHLTCSICYELFQRPVTLMCQHNFCQDCLKCYLQTQGQVLMNKSIPCPTCRQESPVPHPDRPVEEWPGQLKPGILLIGLMDSLQETTRCTVCMDQGEITQASHWCSECEASFCDECLKKHSIMPKLRQHAVTNLKETSTVPKGKKEFLCRKHKERIKLYCRDCKELLCTLCCSLKHRTCGDVVTIKEMLPEVQEELLERRQKLELKVEETKIEISGFGKKWEKSIYTDVKIRTEIEKVVLEVSDYLGNKKDQLFKKLDDHYVQKVRQLSSVVRAKKYKMQMYQHQSQVIQQTVKFEDEKKMFEMFLLPGSETEEDPSPMESSTDGDGAQLCFEYDLDKLKDIIDVMDLKNDLINWNAKPVLQETIEGILTPADKCQLTGVAILNINDTNVTVVTDVNKKRIKSFYKDGNLPRCSSLTLRSPPVSIAVLDVDKMVVSVPGSKLIVTVRVSPALKLDSEISTTKQYTGLDVLDQSTLVASSDHPPSVDVLNLQGQVIRSLSNPHKLFSHSYFTHVTRKGAILVSDWSLKSVVCMSQMFQVLWVYNPTGDRALRNPCGITSSSSGDVLVTDRDTHKVIQLSSSGEFIRDVLTSDQGIEHPIGLFVEGAKLYVANLHKGVRIYRFIQDRFC